MRILGIDPGPQESAYVVIDGKEIILAAKDKNSCVLRQCRTFPEVTIPVNLLAVEIPEPRSNRVGLELFETAFWAGRFAQAWEMRSYPIAPSAFQTVFRRHVKQYFHARNDADVRAAILADYGGSSAKGTKKHPGPLYGIANDIWAALAVALYAQYLLTQSSE